MTRKWLAAVCVASWPAIALGQGFGKIKKSVTMERKLPAAVKMPGSSFSVKATAEAASNSCKTLAADKLQATVETNLIRYNTQLTVNPNAPDTIISIRVLNCSALATPEYGMQFGNNANRSRQPTGYKVTGDLSVTYEARTAAGAFVDAEPLDVKYNHEFNGATAALAQLSGKAVDEPHSAEEVLQILADRMAQRIAARLVNTDERLEVLLGRGGPLEDANRFAQAAQWTQYVEALETMTPFAKSEDDAYRLYNIGVGDEALGYKAETPASAQRYFEQAVIQYRKAGEANPHEKYFIQPVNRIEVALEHYKKLAEQTRLAAAAPATVAPSVQTPAPAAPPVRAQAPPPQLASGPFAKPTVWQVTEIINGAPLAWVLYTDAGSSFKATMGDAVVANGTWRYGAGGRTFDLTGNNLVLRVPFHCTFTLNEAQPNQMGGFCVDQAGTRYRTDAFRR